MYKFESKVKSLLLEYPTISEILDAISKKNIVTINYMGDDNTPSGLRNIEPYLFGNTIAGNSGIRAYQFAGDTATIVPGWKIFLLDKITSWETTNKTFNVRPDYNKNGDKLFKSITRKI